METSKKALCLILLLCHTSYALAARHVVYFENCMQYLLCAAAIQNKPDDLEYYRAQGAPIEVAINNEGKTLLHYVAQLGHTETLEHLLNYGANPSKTDSSGKTALHYAAHYGKANSIKVLLPYLPTINAINRQDNYGKTALHYAAAWGHDRAVKALLYSNAQPNLLDMRRKSPLHYAARWNWPKCVKELLKNLITPIDCTDIHNQTALYKAIRRGFETIAIELLNVGASTNSTELTHGVLQTAIFFGYTNLARLLLKHNPKLIDQLDISKETALHKAVQQGNIEGASLLLYQGACTHVTNKQYETPLHVAIQTDNVVLIKILLRYGAHFYVPSDQTDTVALANVLRNRWPSNKQIVIELAQRGSYLPPNKLLPRKLKKLWQKKLMQHIPIVYASLEGHGLPDDLKNIVWQFTTEKKLTPGSCKGTTNDHLRGTKKRKITPHGESIRMLEQEKKLKRLKIC